jgi:4-hydroxyphenylacetate 3-monooxygenase
MQLPATMRAFDGPIGKDLERFYRGATISAREKTRLFKLAWDLLGSDFGARHTLYEVFYAGDPSMLMAGFHREYAKEQYIKRVQEFLGG